MSWPNNPPGAPSYGAPPSGYNPQAGYGRPAAPAYNPSAPPPGQAPGGYGQAPPGGYAPPAGQAPGGYRPPGQAPGGYGAPPAGQAPGGYGAPPAGQAPGGYGGQAPGGYGAPPGQAPGGYGAPPGQAPGGYGAPGQPYAPQGPPPGVDPDIFRWFQAVDADRSGKITAMELQQALMNGNWTPFNPETCRLMIGMFDKDRNGTIDCHEFSALWKYIQDWKGCFDRFDTDRSGNINTMELQNAFSTFGYRLSPQFCQLCVRVFDRQHSNTMNFDDFIQCCVMLKSLTDKFRAKDTNLNGVIQLGYEDFLFMALDTGVV